MNGTGCTYGGIALLVVLVPAAASSFAVIARLGILLVRGFFDTPLETGCNELVKRIGAMAHRMFLFRIQFREILQ